MKHFIIALFLISSANATGTKLLMIGGGSRPPEAMKAFVEAAGGSQANILVSSWASETTEGAESIQNELNSYRPGSIKILPTFPMKREEEAKLAAMLHRATGIFFAGGDQNQLMLVIQSEELKEVFKNAFANGMVFGGTSAGTAVMSERMILGDGATPNEAPPIGEGLGLLPQEIIVDQHFLVRNRFNRLASLVLQNDHTNGLGIDEGTALMVTNSRIGQVIGPSQVLTFEKTATHKIAVQYHAPNELFNLFGLKQ